MPILSLKLPIQIARRTFCSQGLMALTTTNLKASTQKNLTTNNLNVTRHQENLSKLSLRRVHLSISGNKELGVMTAEDIEKRIKHLLVRILLAEDHLCCLIFIWVVFFLCRTWQQKQSSASKIVTNLMKLILKKNSSLQRWQWVSRLTQFQLVSNFIPAF